MVGLMKLYVKKIEGDRDVITGLSVKDLLNEWFLLTEGAN